MRPIALRNKKIEREDFVELEKRLGGPVSASRSAGVSYATWYRWREGRLPISPSRQRLIELLLHSTRRPFQASTGQKGELVMKPKEKAEPAFVSPRYMDPKGHVVMVTRDETGRWGSFREVDQDGAPSLRQVKSPLLPLVSKPDRAAKHLYAYARVKGWARIPTPTELETMLSLVMQPCPIAAVIAIWSDVDRVLAAGWAVAVHLRAGDNIVRVPPIPTAIVEWRRRKVV